MRYHLDDRPRNGRGVTFAEVLAGLRPCRNPTCTRQHGHVLTDVELDQIAEHPPFAPILAMARAAAGQERPT